MGFKNIFLFAFSYSEICDRSVFNLNHYLLLSYSRMIKVIRKDKIWDPSGILPPFCSPLNASKKTSDLVQLLSQKAKFQ